VQIKEIRGNTINHGDAAHAADLIMQRPDYYAGQISLDAHNLVAAAMQAHSAVQQAPLGQWRGRESLIGFVARLPISHLSGPFHVVKFARLPMWLNLPGVQI
jgi:hypothetical protein